MENLNPQLLEFNELPKEIEGIRPDQIRSIFPHPSLIHLKGHSPKPLFLSLLLHGNETTSFEVLQELSRYIRCNPLPRNLIIFVGNVFACEKHMRFIPGQEDYNRVWTNGKSSEHFLAQKVLTKVSEAGPLFANIDIHNNTGLNPYYACINSLTLENQYLASLFTKTVVYFKTPGSVQAIAFNKLCPSITIECGKSGDPTGFKMAFQLVLDVMHSQSLSPKHKPEIQIFQTHARLKIKDGTQYSFSLKNCTDLAFPPQFERWNFKKLEAGDIFAESQAKHLPLVVVDENEKDCTYKYFDHANGKIIVKQEFVPAMLTQDKTVIAQDCLGYLMRQINTPL